MHNNAFAFLALFCTGLFVLGCGSDGNGDGCLEGQVLCDGMCIDECPVGQVECDCVCIPEIEPMLADIQASVFDISCTASSCHGTQNPQAMLELSSAAVSAENLIDVESFQVPGKNRVVPGDVSASYLYNKITGEDIAPNTQRMPLVGVPLCDEKIAAVEAWIAAGAP